MKLAERLRSELHRGPVAAGLAVVEGIASPEALVDEAAAVACDPRIDAQQRLAALFVTALLAHTRTTLPEKALDALEDDLLIDAAIQHNATPAITGVLAAAGPRVGDAARRYIVVRLVAGQVTGLHLAALQLQLGDAAGAARAAAPSVIAAATRDALDPITLAIAGLLVRGTDSCGARFANDLAEQIPVRACRLFAESARALGAASDHALVLALGQRAVRDS